VDYWNHNVHYEPVILDAVPAGCGTALDVGCGDGLLATRLAFKCAAVTGVDRDASMIAVARERERAPGAPRDASGAAASSGAGAGSVTFVEADFLTQPFGEGTFDFVCANTVIHHMGTEAALRALARVLRPGGRLAVVGLGAYGTPADILPDLAAIPLNRYYRRTRGEWYPDAPKLPPDLTWGQVRRTARRVLPGVRYRRHLLWRYSLIWDKPTGTSAATRREASAAESVLARGDDPPEPPGRAPDGKDRHLIERAQAGRSIVITAV
jgi:SAM-dependent methyltransferase